MPAYPVSSRVTALWAADVEAYRNRLHIIIAERTALTLKLHRAEIALQAIDPSAIQMVA